MTQKRRISSVYMEWAKTHSWARYNLASSDLLNLPLSELGVSPGELELYGGSGYGYPPLLEAIAGRYGVDPARVVTSAGTSMANHLAMAALVEPGDEVLVEEPGYGLLAETAEYLGARVTRFQRRSEEDFRVDPGAIGRAVTSRTRLIVLTNLHNPSGAYTGERTLSEVGAIAKNAGARVLVDEVYLDTAFDARPRSSVHLGDEFVATNSLTKAYGLSGLRCGWILADPALAEKIWRLADLFYGSLPHLTDLLSVAAFRRLPELAARARNLLDANAALANRYLTGLAGLDARPHAQGLVTFPRLVSGESRRFCALLRERYETSAVPGEYFGMPAHVRVGLGRSTEEVEEGLRRFAAAVEETAAGGAG